MNQNDHRSIRYFSTLAIFLFVVLLTAAPASSNEYAALDGVKGIKAVFDVSLGSPEIISF